VTSKSQDYSRLRCFTTEKKEEKKEQKRRCEVQEEILTDRERRELHGVVTTTKEARTI